MSSVLQLDEQTTRRLRAPESVRLTRDDIAEIESNFVCMYHTRRRRLHCSADGCPTSVVTGDPVMFGATFLCRKHTRGVHGRTAEGKETPPARVPERPPFGLIRPGPFEYRGQGDRNPTGFEYLLGNQISFEDANREHMRRLNLTLENRKPEKIDRDIELHQFDRDMRGAYGFDNKGTIKDGKNGFTDFKRSPNRKHKDDPPESIGMYLSQSLLKKTRYHAAINIPYFYSSAWQIGETVRPGQQRQGRGYANGASHPGAGGGGFVYEYDLHDQEEWEAHKNSAREVIQSLIVPSRPDPFEGRAVRASRGGGYRDYTKMMLPHGPSLSRETDPVNKLVGVIEGNDVQETLAETHQGAPLPSAKIAAEFYALAARGKMRYATDPPEVLTRIPATGDFADGRPAVFVNVAHPNWLLATATWFEKYPYRVAGLKNPFDDLDKKGVEAMQTKIRRVSEKFTSEGIDFDRWSVDDLLQVWRDRQPCAVVTSGREVRVFHLDINDPELALYAGLVDGLGGNPRQNIIETKAWQAVDAEFERRTDRAMAVVRGEEAKHAAFTQATRENLNAEVWIIDFGSRSATPETAPDELWHAARTIVDKLIDEKVGNYPELKEIIRFYPDLTEA